jgi:hypothetical protein
MIDKSYKGKDREKCNFQILRTVWHNIIIFWFMT